MIVDVGCRNTVFNDRPQSAAEHVAPLVARGVRRFRVEFVREGQAEARTVLDAYRDLLAGRIDAREAVARTAAAAQVGVSGRPMAIMS